MRRDWASVCIGVPVQSRMRSTCLPRFERHQRLHPDRSSVSPANDAVGSALNLVRLPFLFALAASGVRDTFVARETNSIQIHGVAASLVDRGKGVRT